MTEFKKSKLAKLYIDDILETLLKTSDFSLTRYTTLTLPKVTYLINVLVSRGFPEKFTNLICTEIKKNTEIPLSRIVKECSTRLLQENTPKYKNLHYLMENYENNI